MTARPLTWRQLNALAREQNMNIRRPPMDPNGMQLRDAALIRTDGTLTPLVEIEGMFALADRKRDRVMRAATEAALKALRSKR